jgi:indolepyruvate ferredoxin oxidoreductase alpha subunit
VLRLTVPDLELDAPGKQVILLGNEGIARGFVEGGLQLAAAYPGTPSSEIMESLIRLGLRYGFYTEWSTNEKVAGEVAIAGSMAGLRTMCSMKGVGVNVVSEPFQAFTYMAPRGGIVLVTADDPGLHSSHTEQDNRYYALQMYLPVLEPYDPIEANAMARRVYELSEFWERPVMLRTTTRIGHTSANITLRKVPKKRKRLGDFQRDPPRWVNLPMNARKMRKRMIEKMDDVTKEMDKLEFNWLEGNPNAKVGIITAGISYAYTKEAIKVLKLQDKVHLLKLGLSYPLPYKLLDKLFNGAEKVLVAEEVEPIVERQVRGFAQEQGITIPIHGKKYLPRDGEYSIDALVRGIAGFLNQKSPWDPKKIEHITGQVSALVPPRPPILCAGCMHRGVFFAMKKVEKKLKKDKKKKVNQIVMPSDIGCYTLGYQPPLNAVDTHLCMGASIGVSTGFAHTISDPVICTIGDSTFFHAGIPPLLNSVFNTADITVIILDNSTTAMTGYQPHPGTGVQACGETTKCVHIEDIVSACGIEYLKIVNPYNISETIDAIENAVLFPGPAVVIARRLCRMLELRDQLKRGEPLPNAVIDRDACTNCKACLTQFGCPAMFLDDDHVEIDSGLCNGCGMCIDDNVCRYNAINIE